MSVGPVNPKIFIFLFNRKSLPIHGIKCKEKGAKIEKMWLFLLVVIKVCFQEAVTF